MKLKKCLIFLLAAVIVVSTFTPVLASTHKYGAKAYGMGGAFTAVADDSSAIYWNPAGLAQSGIFRTSISVGADPDNEFIDEAKDVIDAESNQYDQLEALSNLDDTKMNMDVIGTTNIKNFGLGILANNEFTYDDTTKYLLENQITGQGIFSIGHIFADPPLNFGYFAMGFNVKGLWSQYNRVEAVKNSGTTTEYEADAKGYGLDVGFLAKATDMVSLGLNIKNVTSDLDWEWDKNPNPATAPELDDSLPRIVTVGTALNLPLNTTIAADIESIKDGDDIYHLGVEKGLLFNGLSLRAGIHKPENDDRVITGGLGLNLANFHLNLAAADDGYYALSANLDF
ncbi:hypothetical protein [Sporohalobacter salinus]|uniref:hypothetical protein n=1 Tax=Sporohalobacter salinus TaxID=1494606 RepID=UPI001960C45A|nr:hypothetical protein [Sporohalobacter salinus]MBM7623859.1 hypothetical protein [Sporohalobacter salinus]